MEERHWVCVYFFAFAGNIEGEWTQKWKLLYCNRSCAVGIRMIRPVQRGSKLGPRSLKKSTSTLDIRARQILSCRSPAMHHGGKPAPAIRSTPD